MSPSNALQRPDLGASLEEYDVLADRAGYIADKVAPSIDVAQQTANIGRLPLEALLFQRNTKRAPGSPYSRGNYKFEDFSYATAENGTEETVDDRLAKIYRRYIDAEQVATKRAQGVILRNREGRVASMLFNTGTWTGPTLTTGVTNEWDDFTAATPFADVQAAVLKVFNATGLSCNALILNSEVFKNLVQCQDIITRAVDLGLIQTRNELDNLTAQMIARLLFPDVPDAMIVVAGGVKNGANTGQTASPARIWNGEYAMVARIARSNDPQEPCVARSFHYTEDGSSLDGTVETYREESIRGDVVRVRHETAEVVMYKEAAHLLSNITT